MPRQEFSTHGQFDAHPVDATAAHISLTPRVEDHGSHPALQLVSADFQAVSVGAGTAAQREPTEARLRSATALPADPVRKSPVCRPGGSQAGAPEIWLGAGALAKRQPTHDQHTAFTCSPAQLGSARRQT